MKKVFAIALLIMSFSLISLAQNTFSVFVAPEYRVGNFTHSVNAPGWEVSGTYNFVSKFGMTADADGVYHNGSATYGALFGPQFTLVTKPKFDAYIHGLAGIAHGNSTSAFSYAFGGGVDIPVSKSWSIRPAQLDYLAVNAPKGYVSTLRYSGGLVFKF